MKFHCSIHSLDIRIECATLYPLFLIELIVYALVFILHDDGLKIAPCLKMIGVISRKNPWNFEVE